MNVLRHLGSVEPLSKFLMSKKFIKLSNSEVLSHFESVVVCFREPLDLSRAHSYNRDLCWSRISAILQVCVPSELLDMKMWEQLCCQVVDVMTMYVLLCEVCMCVPLESGSYIAVNAGVADSMLRVAAFSDSTTVALDTTAMCLHALISAEEISRKNDVANTSLTTSVNRQARVRNRKRCKRRNKKIELQIKNQEQYKSMKKTRRSKRKKQKVVDNRKAYNTALQIPTSTILYNLSIDELWPPCHIMSKAEDAESFLDNVLSTNVGVELKLPQSECLLELSRVLWSLIVRHRRLHHRRLLEHHAQTMHSEGHHVLSSSEVYMFASDVLRRVVPLEVFGSRRNRRLFLASVKKLTFLGLRHNMALGTLLYGLRTSSVKWLDCTLGHATCLHILAKVMLWLFNEYVVVLLKSFFYITESSSGYCKPVFYWKRHWRSMQEAALRHSKFVDVSQAKAANIAAGDKTFKSSFGIGRIRFIPKERGLRAIQTLRNVSPGTSSMAEKAKFLLCQLNKHRGFSLKTSLHDCLHTMWLELDVASQPRLYLVKTDIIDAYGSIDHKKLVAILLQLRKELLERGPSLLFTVYRAVRLYSSRNKPQVKQHLVFDGIPGVFPANSLLIYSEKKSVSAQELFSVLLSYVQRQIVQVCNRWYWVAQGLPHGGTLSPSLCDLYYGTMEFRHLRKMCAPTDRLVRIVDDFLFVTCSELRAQQFAKLMMNGFPSYNCSVNEAKTEANAAIGSIPASSVLSFCGVEIVSESLELKANYAKMRGCNTAYYLQLKCTDHPGRFLKSSLLLMASLKLSPVFLDEAYNSAATVLQTVYKAALMSAFRLHAIVCCTFSKHGMGNQRFLTSIIAATASKLARLVLRNSSPLHSGPSSLSFHVIRWLAFCAFHAKLSRHGGKYKQVVHDVRYLLRRTGKELDNCTLQKLQEATRDKLPDPFHTMK